MYLATVCEVRGREGRKTCLAHVEAAGGCTPVIPKVRAHLRLPCEAGVLQCLLGLLHHILQQQQRGLELMEKVQKSK